MSLRETQASCPCVSRDAVGCLQWVAVSVGHRNTRFTVISRRTHEEADALGSNARIKQGANGVLGFMSVLEDQDGVVSVRPALSSHYLLRCQMSDGWPDEHQGMHNRT